MLFTIHKGPPVLHLPTWSNHSHLLLFLPLWKGFRFLFLSSFFWSDLLLLCHLQWFLGSYSLSTLPLSLRRSEKMVFSLYYGSCPSLAAPWICDSCIPQETWGPGWPSLSQVPDQSCCKMGLTKCWVSILIAPSCKVMLLFKTCSIILLFKTTWLF